MASEDYLTAAIALTRETADFNAYELAERVEQDLGRPVFYRNAGRWIRRNARGHGPLRRMAAQTYGPGADPARYAVIRTARGRLGR